jgi:type I restriction-modification system DNA methylase subunit
MKINGRCAVVLPTGKELNSKSDKSLIMLRKFLMKTCDLKRIIHLPSGIFEHASVSTCVLYFEKKKNGNEYFHSASVVRKHKRYEYVMQIIRDIEGYLIYQIQTGHANIPALSRF